MSTPGPSGNPSKLSEEEAKTVLKHYDEDADGKFSKEEIHKLAEDFKTKSLKDPSLIKIVEKFDVNKDGILDDGEKEVMEEHLNSTLRYAGYSAVFARAFRYLAFTSGK